MTWLSLKELFSWISLQIYYWVTPFNSYYFLQLSKKQFKKTKFGTYWGKNIHASLFSFKQVLKLFDQWNGKLSMKGHIWFLSKSSLFQKWSKCSIYSINVSDWIVHDLTPVILIPFERIELTTLTDPLKKLPIDQMVFLFNSKSN